MLLNKSLNTLPPEITDDFPYLQRFIWDMGPTVKVINLDMSFALCTLCYVSAKADIKCYFPISCWCGTHSFVNPTLIKNTSVCIILRSEAFAWLYGLCFLPYQPWRWAWKNPFYMAKICCFTHPVGCCYSTALVPLWYAHLCLVLLPSGETRGRILRLRRK